MSSISSLSPSSVGGSLQAKSNFSFISEISERIQDIVRDIFQLHHVIAACISLGVGIGFEASLGITLFATYLTVLTIKKVFFTGRKRFAKSFLKETFQETQKITEQGHYTVRGKKIVLDPKAMASMRSSATHIKNPPVATVRISGRTKVCVANEDSFDCALRLKRKGLNPAVLNMAHQTHIGGGVVRGTRAQEETLCRRSTLYESLKASVRLLGCQIFRYCIAEFGGVYSPSVLVFKDENYNLMKKPHEVAVISSAAYDLNKGLVDDFEEKTKKKIRGILRIAAQKGHDAVVLGAFGCGAFKQDPKVVAKLFKAVLSETEFNRCFKEINFAVLDDQTSSGNFRHFRRILG